MKCFIDNREKDRVKSGLSHFGKFNPIIMELPVGDYVFSNNGITVVFEYKTLSDFIGSTNDYRVFNQALNQTAKYDYHFVIVVGSENDYKKAKDKLYYSTGMQFTNKQFNGAIASLVEFTSILQVKNESLAFDLMERIANKCTRDKPIIHRFPKSKGSPAYRFLANNVNGIANKTAEKICKELDLLTIIDVLELNVDKLTSVKGIGKKKATNILKQIIGEYS